MLFDNYELENEKSFIFNQQSFLLNNKPEKKSKTQNKTENNSLKKLDSFLSKIKDSFNENSDPIYFDHNKNQIPLIKIHQIESISGRPVTLIAVTRHQYNTKNFTKYENYVKKLGHARIYYGFWPDTQKNKIELDVLYCIATDDQNQIQEHLNMHDAINQQTPQSMALVITKGGKSHVVENLKIKKE